MDILAATPEVQSKYIVTNYMELNKEQKTNIMRLIREHELATGTSILLQHSDGIRVRLNNIPADIIEKIIMFISRCITSVQT